MSNVTKQQTARRHAKDSGENRRVPSLRHHKATGQAYAVLNGKAVYFGRSNDPQAKQKYHQAIAEWLAAGKLLPVNPCVITVKEVISRFWAHGEQYYRTLTDGRNKELEQFQLALRPLKELYGQRPAADFGPRALKAVRQKMIEKGWCRPYVNKQTNRIRLVFKWAVSDELIPGEVLHALQAVPGLRKGRAEAPEPEAVKPVPMELVEAVWPFVSRQVWAMVQLQLLTGARAGELTRMRPCDIDRSGEVWVYRLGEHKTAHHGHDRRIFLGPRAQKVIAPFLLRDSDAYCFCPAEAVEEWRRQAFKNRKTPVGQGNSPGTNCKANPKWMPGERYKTDTYRCAIARACDRAFPPPERLARHEGEAVAQGRKRLSKQQKDELATWRRAHRWHPHQLRHNAATGLRKEFGIETARIILGHRSAAITEVYAEKDEQVAIEAIMRVG